MEVRKRRYVVDYDKMAWIVTTALLLSFFVFMTEDYGKYIYLLLSFIMVVLSILKHGGSLFVGRTPYIIVSVCYILFLLASAIWAYNPMYALISARTTTMSCFYSFSVYLYYRDQESIEPLLNAVIVAGVIVALETIRRVGLGNLILMGINGTRLLNEYFINVNVISMTCAYAIVNVFFRFRRDKNIAWIILVLPMVVVWVVTGSKKGLILPFLMIAVFFMFQSRRNMKRLFKNIIVIVICSAVVLAILYYIPFSSEFVNRTFDFLFEFFGADSLNESDMLRKNMIVYGIQQFLESPILGIGAGNAVYVGKRITGTEVYLHNNYVELLASIGLVGMLIYYLYYMIPLNSLRKDRDDEYSWICLSILVTNLVMDFATVSVGDRENYFYLVIVFLQCEHIKSNKRLRKREII